jgi:hypothetical protein
LGRSAEKAAGKFDVRLGNINFSYPIITFGEHLSALEPQLIASPCLCAGLPLINTFDEPAEAVAECGGLPGQE